MSISPKDALSRLQDWYASQCNGDWEHQCGVKIDTLDNPGWHLEIDLGDTSLMTRPFDEIRSPDYESSDWYICRVKNYVFDAACSPHRLTDVIEIFLRWAAA
jgi:hypothetical protein